MFQNATKYIFFNAIKASRKHIFILYKNTETENRSRVLEQSCFFQVKEKEKSTITYLNINERLIVCSKGRWRDLDLSHPVCYLSSVSFFLVFFSTFPG